jgi:hypothetical protein
MYDRCKGQVTTFVDGVPVCGVHRKHAISNASPEARIDEAGDWVLKKPKDITLPPIPPSPTVYEIDESELEESGAPKENYCFLCAWEGNKLVLATRVRNLKHVCDEHFKSFATRRKHAKKKTSASNDDVLVLKPRRIRLPEDE